MSGIYHRFRRISEPVEGAWRKYLQTTCYKCGRDDRVNDSTVLGMPPDMASKKFRQKGWRLGTKAGDDLCPACAKAPQAAPFPPMRPETIANGGRRVLPDLTTPQPMNEEISQMSKPELKAEPPRNPTPADRRRISDALEEHYLTDKGCYRQAWTDAALGQKLATPAAWVKDVREMLFGDGDGNEAKAQQSEAVEALEKQLAEVSAEMLAKFDDLEKALKRIKLDRSYAA